MKFKSLCLGTIIGIAIPHVLQAQNDTSMNENNKNNPLMCDFETGLCETPLKSDEVAAIEPEKPTRKTVRIIYFTDPICSSCWGIEPQLRKLKLEYGDFIEMEYRMGGLLPDWSYNSGGISKPSDVAAHWDEASQYYQMPIDGDVWLEDPLESSYPPSIAFKAAQIQNEEKAHALMRELREMVFLRKVNIAKWENIVLAAEKVGLDLKRFETDYQGQAKNLFNEDLLMAKQFGVRGFPTLFFMNEAGDIERVYGSKPYQVFETALKKADPKAVARFYKTDWESLFQAYPSLTFREFVELSGMNYIDAEKLLVDLVEKKSLKEYKTKNGSIWFLTK